MGLHPRLPLAELWLGIVDVQSPASFFVLCPPPHSFELNIPLLKSPETPGELSEENSSVAQQKDRTISISHPVPRATVDEGKGHGPWTTSTSGAAFRRNPSARKRTVLPPLGHSNSTRSRNSNRDITPPLGTASSALSKRGLTLQTMGITKPSTGEDGRRWKEPTLRESFVAIYKSSCASPFLARDILLPICRKSVVRASLVLTPVFNE